MLSALTRAHKHEISHRKSDHFKMRITQLASTPLAGLGTVAPIPYVIPGRARKQDPKSGHPHTALHARRESSVLRAARVAVRRPGAARVGVQAAGLTAVPEVEGDTENSSSHFSGDPHSAKEHPKQCTALGSLSARAHCFLRGVGGLRRSFTARRSHESKRLQGTIRAE